MANLRTTRKAAKPATKRPARSHVAPSSGIAAIVKTFRHNAKLTLNELAQRANVAASTISKIESGQLSPGYEIIVRLAQGLGIDVADMFRAPQHNAATGRRGVTRRGCGVQYSTPNYAYQALVNDVSRKEFIPLLTTIKARERMSWNELPAHDGEEFVYVLKGAVRLFSEHYEPLDLDVGDCVYFDSRAGHALASIGEEDAEVMWICSHPDAMTHVNSGVSDEGEQRG